MESMSIGEMTAQRDKAAESLHALLLSVDSETVRLALGVSDKDTERVAAAAVAVREQEERESRLVDKLERTASHEFTMLYLDGIVQLLTAQGLRVRFRSIRTGRFLKYNESIIVLSHALFCDSISMETL